MHTRLEKYRCPNILRVRLTNLALSAVLLVSPACALAGDYKVEANVLYRDAGITQIDDYARERCRLDLYYPAGMSGYATVVWFHGGGLKNGERYIPEGLKEKGIAVAAANYRLNPKVQSPTYVEDAAAAVAWVFKNIERFGGDPKKVFVSGHSAGGYLTSMITLDKKYLAPYGIDSNSIAGAIPFSGHTITHMTVRDERGVSDLQPVVDEMAPLFHVRKDAPPYVIITGDRELEMLGRYEENLYMWRMMKLVGHPQTYIYELDGYNHGEMAVPAVPILLKHIKKVIQTME